MRRHIKQALNILDKIMSDGLYGDEALTAMHASDMATKLVYGVLEQNVRIEYILTQLAERRPQRTVYILLKIGIYALENLSDVPTFAIVSECVEVAKSCGKSGVSGFVNAVLKRAAAKQYELPKTDDQNYLSIKYSKPQWFIDVLQKEYPVEYERILAEPIHEEEHIRPNLRKMTVETLKKRLESADIAYSLSEVGGVNVRLCDYVKELFKNGDVTLMSPSSMLCVEALEVKGAERVLDLCAAPGGKSAYISELAPKATIVACDVNPKRFGQLKSYISRMGATNVRPVMNDGAIFKKEWEGAFDRVLVDAPCSCLGTFNRRPDVLLRPKYNVEELAKLQSKLLKNAVRYLKKGGILVYSTCTFTSEENERITDLVVNGDIKYARSEPLEKLGYSNEGRLRVLPNKNYDGFYIAKMTI